MTDHLDDGGDARVVHPLTDVPLQLAGVDELQPGQLLGQIGQRHQHVRVAGAEHPGSPCLVCSPDEDAEGWSPKLEGTSCGGCLECDGTGECAVQNHDECGRCEKCSPFGDCVSQAEGEDVKGECPSSYEGGDPCATGGCDGGFECAMREGRCAECGTCDPFLGCVAGEGADAICSAAREHDVDLIVIGSHGYGILDRLLGTTAAKVVNHADRSVLVVRSHELRTRV